MSPLAYDVAGSGEPVVLVHGLASSRGCWADVAPLLAEDFRVFTVDLPGHGDTAPPVAPMITPADMAVVLAEFLQTQGLDSAHLVGNSLGGWVALEAAANGIARSVTGLAPAGLWTPLRKRGPLVTLNHTMATTLRPAIPAILAVAPLRWALLSSGMQRPRTLSYAMAVDAAMAQVRASGFDAAIDGTINREFARADDIGENVPVTIAFGDNDRILNAARCQRRELAPAHARWDIIDNCGHAPMYDVPEITAELIRTTVTSA